MSETVTAVDLFCGAGGTLEGLSQACDDHGLSLEVTAVNHSEVAIETHKRNHPNGDHHVSKVEELHPPDVADEGGVDVLIASPECTHFSTARGGKPVCEQKRASPWHVLDWVEKLRPENVLLENVRELKSWGPIGDDGQPSRNGEIFETWIDAFHALGYSVDWRVLNAADYGDATSRDRLFVIGSRDRRATFPQPTHADGRRSAAEIIDWSDPGESIWARDRPLVNNTMQRIAEGLRRHGDKEIEPFADVVETFEKADVHEMQEDVVEIETLDEEIVADRAEPFLVKYYGTSTTRPLDEPLDTVTAGGQKFGLCIPYLLRQQTGGSPPSVEEPCPTIAARGSISKIEADAFVLPRNGSYRGLHSNPAHDPHGRPLHTVTAENGDGHLLTPALMQFSHGGKLLDRDEPLPTITTAKGGVFALSSPFLVEYYGNGGPQDIDEPLPTVTTKDRFALIVPELFPLGLDIRFRMLKPRELARAMGFPDDYEFAGNKTETTRQIGNAVPVNLAKALCEQLLVEGQPSLENFGDEGVEADD